MDKKSILAFGIIALILVGFTIYSGKQQKKLAEQQAITRAEQLRQDSIYRANNPIIEQETAAINNNVNDSIARQRQLSVEEQKKQHFGDYLYEAENAQEQLYTVENDLVKMVFSNKGGRVKAVELKEYTRFGGGVLEMFVPESTIFDMSFFITRNFHPLEVTTGNYHFTTDAPSSSTFAENETVKNISMKLYVDSLSFVEYLYTIPKDNYMIDLQVNFVNMEAYASNNSNFDIKWANTSFQNERGFKNENNYTTIFFKYPNDRSPDDLGISDGSKSEDIRTRVQWIAFKQQFFSSVFIAKNNFESALIGFDTHHADSGFVKDFRANMAVSRQPQEVSYDFQFYFGPNKYSILRQYDLGMEKLVPLGWGIFGWINRFLIIPIFDFLGKFIDSYGIIILILTIVIKLLIAPLTYKSYLSSAKMRLLKPEMEEINARYPKQEDAMKKQQATMELYRKAGVNPMGGCIPLLIQMPVLIAMVRFFPASIELRGESFLWATDLSSYDSIFDLPFSIPFYGSHVSLFALLMGVTMFFSSKINYNQTASTTAGPQMASMKFMMLYLMPIMMVVLFNSYSSAMTYYFFLSSLITIGQTYAFRLVVDDKKLHAKMKANAKAPQKAKKKSKFMQRYENMLQEAQKQQQARNKK